MHSHQQSHSHDVLGQHSLPQEQRGGQMGRRGEQEGTRGEPGERRDGIKAHGGGKDGKQWKLGLVFQQLVLL